MQQRRERRQRRTLSEREIVDAAMALADADGIDAVSMRNVAQELGVGAMTLYSYVESKDDLIALMADRLMEQFLVPGPLPQDWRAALTAIATRSRETLVRHAWVMDGIGRGRTEVTDNAAKHADQSLEAAAMLTSSRKMQERVIFTIDDFVIGSAVRQIAGRHGENADQRFEQGLQWLLDGIEQDVLSARSSAGSRRRRPDPGPRGRR
jgi:AcrR family transcriptional regulator